MASRPYRTLPAALALALSLPPSARADRPMPPRPAPAPASSCLGRWQGTGGNGGEPWSIDMRVTAEEGARCGTIEYPSLRCGGHLVDCHRRGDVVTWTEVYTHNPGTCAPAGRIDARCEADLMRWTWTGQEVVRAMLRRAAPGW
jgi:hypothetical protein